MKKFFLFGLLVGMSAVLCAEGLRFGMAGAVKQKVVQLDEKVVEKKAATTTAQPTVQTLSAANDTVAAGYYAATTLSLVDTDLAVGNIKPGVTIFGFAGTYTSDADAIAGNILSGKTAYVNGVKLTGSLATQTLSAANDTVTAGNYDATTLSAVDTDLAVENIKSGVTIFGKTGTIALPDTGQVTSYATTFDDDADYVPATTQMNYTDNGDGTTTDNRTGLMWAKDGSGAGCNNGAALNWENAGLFCQNLTFATYTDWRLPNAKELFSLVKFEGTAPFIDQTSFPNTVSDYYWTSTTCVPGTTNAVSVTFNKGYVDYNDKTNTIYVRPVRGGP